MALRCHQQQELEVAERLYTEALRLDQRHPLAWLHRGHIRLLRGASDSAIEDLTRAIPMNPDNPLVYRWRGDGLGVRGQFDAAIADYNRVRELSPDSMVARYNRSVMLRQSGQLDEAWAELEHLVRLRPRQASLYLNRGLICLARGKREEAIREFRMAIAFKPDSQEAIDRLQELGAGIEEAVASAGSTVAAALLSVEFSSTTPTLQPLPSVAHLPQRLENEAGSRTAEKSVDDYALDLLLPCPRESWQLPL